MNHGGPAGPFFVHAHHGGHPVFWLLVLLALAAVLFFAVRALANASGRRSPALAGWPGAHGDAALDSVRLRYARGEIDRDEFTRISTDLGSPPPAQ
jgi:uncharacterized membrane protein